MSTPGLPSRRQVLGGAAGALVGLALPAPAAQAAEARTAREQDAAAALAWVQTTYDLVLQENLTPPVAARVYAYTAVAMYEAVVGGMPGRRSLSDSLTALDEPPDDAPARTDWSAAMVTAAAAVLREALPARTQSHAVLDRAEQDAVALRTRSGVPAAEVEAGVQHGRRVGRHLARWVAADGHAGTVGRRWTPPTGDAWLWESTPPTYRPAIDPHWSSVRPLVLPRADAVAPAPPVPFSAEPGSAFHQQAMATYRQSAANTAEHEEIARFWADGAGSPTPPFATPTGLPSGHWMLIATQALARRGARLDVAVEVLALTGIALHDAFLNCWTWKYRYHLVRPVTYINRYIDPAWTSLLPTPPFPEHTSGHSVASAAAAAVLTAQLGPMAFTDHTHDARGHQPRRFTSFEQAALEGGLSRLYGGIHYPHALSAGYEQGAAVGALVLRRVRTRD